MPQLTPQILVYPGAQPWLPEYSIPADSELIDRLVGIPGARYRKAKALWEIPTDVAALLELPSPLGLPSFGEHRTKVDIQGLHEYQAEAAYSILFDGGSGLLNFEMGLGKSAAALRISQGAKVLIVCPAIVRDNWRREILRWTPYVEGEIEVCYSGEDVDLASNGARYMVVSYELANKLLDAHLGHWNYLILDEIHYAKDLRAGRTKAVQALRQRCTHVLGLTATPLTNDAKDMWAQLDLVWPGRFGTDFWAFAKRYCSINEGDYGLEIKGLNPFHSAELQARLDFCVCRVTKQQVRHLLPPATVTTRRLKPKKRGNLREYETRLLNMRLHEAGLDEYLEKVSAEKLDDVVAEVKMAQNGGQAHVMVLTHFRSTAETLGQRLGAQVITGDMPASRRDTVLQAQAAARSSITAATMHSIGIGINCSFVTYAIFAELYWQPAVVVQAVGRFHRLGSVDPVQIVFMVAEGTLDEKMAYVLGRKLKDLEAVLKPGVAEADLLTAVKGAEMTAQEFLSRLNEVTDAMVEEDPFFG